MARPKGSNTNAAERLLDAAGRGFRTGGYGGVGVDGLAKEAGLTSGAFYAHFKSKTDAFREVVKAGLRAVQTSVRSLRAARGADWVPALIDFYLTDRRLCDLSEACPLQSLTPEVMRAPPETRAAYQVELSDLIDAMTEGDHGLGQGDAYALLALLSGGVTLARAVEDSGVADDIAASVRTAAVQLVCTGAGTPS